MISSIGVKLGYCGRGGSGLGTLPNNLVVTGILAQVSCAQKQAAANENDSVSHSDAEVGSQSQVSFMFSPRLYCHPVAIFSIVSRMDVVCCVHVSITMVVLDGRPKLVTMPAKQVQREKRREAKAEVAAVLDRVCHSLDNMAFICTQDFSQSFFEMGTCLSFL